VEGLWERLGVEEHERKKFLNGNRGCGVRQINEFEDELSRLNELKRQNLHLFVEDARYKLQELWDGLYFSEEEMLEFTPAFSDVYSDALLEAHEQEIDRLEALKEQRGPTLALIDTHRALVKERDDLQASSQDASRLMMRGQKGEKRDPTRLLREEKMRKRVAKELPKVAQQVRKALEAWEAEYARPFLVHGERYLDELEASEAKPAPGPRSKTPAGPPPSAAKTQKSVPASRAASVMAPPPRSGAKTPVAGGGTIRRNQPISSASAAARGSPSKIPARAPLSSLASGNNSPERRTLRADPRQDMSTIRGKMLPPARAPPPKMRDLFVPPEAPTPVSQFRPESVASSGSVRHVSPEDVYDDRYTKQPQPPTPAYHDHHSSMRHNESFCQPSSYPAAPTRHISNTSSATTNISGSENWETYSEVSEPEPDASDAYYAKLRAARGKRFTPDDAYPRGNMIKKQKGIPPYGHAGHAYIDAEGNRIVSGSEANWTDEDAF
jgi:Ase1/PRC1/MAP65 family protein